MLEKQKILENIHELVSKNVIGDKQLFNRYKGFKAELSFEEYLQEKYHNSRVLEGGMIFSKDSEISSLTNSVYVTCISDLVKIEDYLEIYSLLSKLGFDKMFIVQYSLQNCNMKPVMKFPNQEVSLPVPQLKIYILNKDVKDFEFCGEQPLVVSSLFQSRKLRPQNRYPIEEKTKKWLLNNLIHFRNEALIKIYVNRLIFDGFLGFGKKKGKSSDIDLIIKKNDNSYRFLEIKEKDLPKRSKKGFGLDVPRIQDFQKIEQTSGVSYHLIIRHIDNQKDRNLLSWKHISVKEFIDDCSKDKTIEGGTGMRSVHSKNPTLICSYEKFKSF